MTDLRSEPMFDSPEEELAWLKNQISYWKLNQNVVSADAILQGYQVRYQQLCKGVSQRKVVPEPKTPKVTTPANNKSKSDDQKERDPKGPTLLNFMPVSTMLAIVLIVIFGIMYVLN
tara:strand:- start:37 stop:387 length:351 start_codon:yes stop_codon:yes gene_type:complete